MWLCMGRKRHKKHQNAPTSASATPAIPGTPIVSSNIPDTPITPRQLRQGDGHSEDSGSIREPPDHRHSPTTPQLALDSSESTPRNKICRVFKIQAPPSPPEDSDDSYTEDCAVGSLHKGSSRTIYDKSKSEASLGVGCERNQANTDYVPRLDSFATGDGASIKSFSSLSRGSTKSAESPALPGTNSTNPSSPFCYPVLQHRPSAPFNNHVNNYCDNNNNNDNREQENDQPQEDSSITHATEQPEWGKAALASRHSTSEEATQYTLAGEFDKKGLEAGDNDEETDGDNWEGVETHGRDRWEGNRNHRTLDKAAARQGITKSKSFSMDNINTVRASQTPSLRKLTISNSSSRSIGLEPPNFINLDFVTRDLLDIANSLGYGLSERSQHQADALTLERFTAIRLNILKSTSKLLDYVSGLLQARSRVDARLLAGVSALCLELKTNLHEVEGYALGLLAASQHYAAQHGKRINNQLRFLKDVNSGINRYLESLEADQGPGEGEGGSESANVKLGNIVLLTRSIPLIVRTLASFVIKILDVLPGKPTYLEEDVGGPKSRVQPTSQSVIEDDKGSQSRTRHKEISLQGDQNEQGPRPSDQDVKHSANANSAMYGKGGKATEKNTDGNRERHANGMENEKGIYKQDVDVIVEQDGRSPNTEKSSQVSQKESSLCNKEDQHSSLQTAYTHTDSAQPRGSTGENIVSNQGNSLSSKDNGVSTGNSCTEQCVEVTGYDDALIERVHCRNQSAQIDLGQDGDKPKGSKNNPTETLETSMSTNVGEMHREFNKSNNTNENSRELNKSENVIDEFISSTNPSEEHTREEAQLSIQSAEGQGRSLNEESQQARSFLPNKSSDYTSTNQQISQDPLGQLPLATKHLTNSSNHELPTNVATSSTYSGTPNEQIAPIPTSPVTKVHPNSILGTNHPNQLVTSPVPGILSSHSVQLPQHGSSVNQSFKSSHQSTTSNNYNQSAQGTLSQGTLSKNFNQSAQGTPNQGTPLKNFNQSAQGHPYQGTPSNISSQSVQGTPPRDQFRQSPSTSRSTMRSLTAANPSPITSPFDSTPAFPTYEYLQPYAPEPSVVLADSPDVGLRPPELPPKLKDYSKFRQDSAFDSDPQYASKMCGTDDDVTEVQANSPASIWPPEGAMTQLKGISPSQSDRAFQSLGFGSPNGRRSAGTTAQTMGGASLQPDRASESNGSRSPISRKSAGATAQNTTADPSSHVDRAAPRSVNQGEGALRGLVEQSGFMYEDNGTSGYVGVDTLPVRNVKNIEQTQFKSPPVMRRLASGRNERGYSPQAQQRQPHYEQQQRVSQNPPQHLPPQFPPTQGHMEGINRWPGDRWTSASDLSAPDIRASGVSPSVQAELEELRRQAESNSVATHADITGSLETFGFHLGTVGQENERTGGRNSGDSRGQMNINTRGPTGEERHRQTSGDRQTIRETRGQTSAQTDDARLLLFYCDQISCHWSVLDAAASSFFRSIDSNQPPKVFIAHSHYVMLAGRKMGYLGDALMRSLVCEEPQRLVDSHGGALCEALKAAVRATRDAALTYPGVSQQQRMVDSVKDVTDRALDLKDVVFHLAYLGPTQSTGH